MAKAKIVALAYMRTSSAANIGADKDSEKRQRAAIAGYAKRNGYGIDDADWFNDPAVSGADRIEDRPGFAKLLARIDGNCVRVVIVESADRFARELMIQELGIAVLQARGVKLLTAGGDELTDTSDPTRTMLRQIMGAFSQFEKSRLVAKLHAARKRSGNLGGPERVSKKTVAAARVLARVSGIQWHSLRGISDTLASAGHVSSSGKPFSASVIKSMIGDAPRAPRPRG